MSLGSDEVPSIISILYHRFPSVHFLHEWESISFSFFVGVFISLVFYFGTRNNQLKPKGFQNFLEFFAESFREGIVDIIGPEGTKYVPFLATIFVYILSMNWIGLLPLMRSPTSNLSITAGMAISVFCYVQYLNFKHMGAGGFFYHLAGSPKGTMGWMMVPLMLPMEIITQFARPLTLALRLCGNILGEDLFIGLSVIFGVYLLSDFALPIGLPVQLPFLFLSLFTGFLQALVFTLLSTIYILLSMSDAEGEHPS